MSAVPRVTHLLELAAEVDAAILHPGDGVLLSKSTSAAT